MTKRMIHMYSKQKTRPKITTKVIIQGRVSFFISASTCYSVTNKKSWYHLGSPFGLITAFTGLPAGVYLISSQSLELISPDRACTLILSKIIKNAIKQNPGIPGF